MSLQCSTVIHWSPSWIGTLWQCWRKREKLKVHGRVPGKWYLWDTERKKMAKKLEGQKKLLKEQKGNSTSIAVLSMRSIYLLLLKKPILVSLELHSGPLLPAVRRNVLGSKTSLLPSVVSLFFSVPFPVLCQSGGRQCSWRCDGGGSHVVHSHEGHQCGPAAASLLHFPSSCSHADFIL